MSGTPEFIIKNLYSMLWKAYPRKTQSTVFDPNLRLLIGTLTLAKQPVGTCSPDQEDPTGE
jgi:hypothetical protein